MVTSDGKLISKDRSKMPGFFSMLDGTSKTINICSGDRNIEMHSEMYFMKMSLDFINTLDADMIVKDNPTFFLFTFSSPCFKCLEEYKIINSKLFKNSSFEIFFYNIFQKNNINYLLKSEFDDYQISASSDIQFTMLENSIFRNECLPVINHFLDSFTIYYKNKKERKLIHQEITVQNAISKNIIKNNKINQEDLINMWQEVEKCINIEYEKMMNSHNTLLQQQYFFNFHFTKVEIPIASGKDDNFEIDFFINDKYKCNNPLSFFIQQPID